MFTPGATTLSGQVCLKGIIIDQFWSKNVLGLKKSISIFLSGMALAILFSRNYNTFVQYI